MDYTYGIVMKVITYTLVMFIFPFLILIIVNTRIVLTLKRSTNMRASHTSRKSLLSKTNSRYVIHIYAYILVLSLQNLCGDHVCFSQLNFTYIPKSFIVY